VEVGAFYVDIPGRRMAHRELFRGYNLTSMHAAESVPHSRDGDLRCDQGFGLLPTDYPHAGLSRSRAEVCFELLPAVMGVGAADADAEAIVRDLHQL
jgi:hypothetical protein